MPHDQFAVCRFGFVRYVQLGQVSQQSEIEEEEILVCLGSACDALVWVVKARLQFGQVLQQLT